GARKFTIGPAISLGPPTPVSPLSGTTSAGWPTFVVNNSSRNGPVGALSYRFEVSSSASFSPIILTSTVAETASQSRFTPSTSQPLPTAGTTLYWRATAIDTGSGTTSPASATQSFTPAQPTQASLIAAQLGVPLWPGAQPTGTNGQARLGPGWSIG